MLVAILNFLRAWRRYNTSLRELYQLGDRELADIGITRSDIPRIAPARKFLTPRRPHPAGAFALGHKSLVNRDRFRVPPAAICNSENGTG